MANASISVYGENQPDQNTRTDVEGKFKLKACEGRVQISANKSGQTRLSGSIQTEGGATDVKIIISERQSTTRYEPKRPPSLVGRSLPELKNLSIKLLPDTTDKIVLVCFFDMEQRPSRNCLMQLSKRAQELQEKDVSVVAVQASKIDENTLNEWIKGQNISFPVGMIQTDEEKTRFTWGIRSLPWLILTDKNHIVCSNGFSLGELDNKIQSAQEK